MRLIHVASLSEARFRLRRACIMGEPSPAEYIDEDGTLMGKYVPVVCDRYHIAPDNTIGGAPIEHVIESETLDRFLPWIEASRASQQDLNFDYLLISRDKINQHHARVYYHEHDPGAVTVVSRCTSSMSWLAVCRQRYEPRD